MLSAVHLDELARTPARVLSRGQKQRLGLARALVHHPQVLLLDEPAAGMDPRSRADLRVLLRDLAASGVTVLVSSHILPELEQMVDGVIFMARGQAVAPPSPGRPGPDDRSSCEGPHNADGGSPPRPPGGPVRPQPIRRVWRMQALDAQRLADWAASAPVHAVVSDDDAARLAVPDEATAAHVLREALDAGVDVVSFAPAGGSLEEIYLSMEGERR